MSPAVVAAMFGAGVLSIANPCVLPLVPVWSAVALGAAPERPGDVVRSTLPFVAGMAVVFAALGAAAGSLGGLVSATTTWVPRVGGMVLVVFGVLLLGIGPRWAFVDRRPRLSLPARSHRAGAVPLRGVVAGAVAGAAWTPCVGPLLGAALVAASSAGGAAPGAALLAVYAAGVGVPFVAAALAFDAWPQWSSTVTRHIGGVRIAGALLLVGTGAALAAGVLDRLVGPAAALLPG